MVALVPVVSREGTPFFWSKDAQRFPWLVWCERERCVYYVAALTEERGQVLLALHDCPRWTPAKEGLLVSQTLLEQAWDELDDVVQTLYEGNLDPEQKLRFQGEARGIAKIIQLFMKIFYADVAAVSAEAKKRYEAKKA